MSEKKTVENGWERVAARVGHLAEAQVLMRGGSWDRERTGEFRLKRGTPNTDRSWSLGFQFECPFCVF